MGPQPQQVQQQQSEQAEQQQTEKQQQQQQQEQKLMAPTTTKGDKSPAQPPTKTDTKTTSSRETVKELPVPNEDAGSKVKFKEENEKGGKATASTEKSNATTEVH